MPRIEAMARATSDQAFHELAATVRLRAEMTRELLSEPELTQDRLDRGDAE
jgi:hypothetical protein